MRVTRRKSTHKRKRVRFSTRKRIHKRKRGGNSPRPLSITGTPRKEPTSTVKRAERAERLNKLKIARLNEDKKRFEEGVAAANEIDVNLRDYIVGQPAELENKIKDFQAFHGNPAPGSYDKYSPIRNKSPKEVFNRLKPRPIQSKPLKDLVIPTKKTGRMKRLKNWIKRKTRKNIAKPELQTMGDEVTVNPIYNSLSSPKSLGRPRSLGRDVLPEIVMTPGSDTITDNTAKLQ